MNTTKSLRRTMAFGYLSIAALLAGFGGWSAMAELNGAVIAHATLVVESYSKKVQHPQGGVVAKIFVKDGDRVEQGQPLLTLDPTEAKAELAIVGNSLEDMRVKKARLDAQRDGVATLALPADLEARKSEAMLAELVQGQLKLLQSADESLRGKVEQLRQQLGQLREQIGGIDAQVASKQEQTRLIGQELANLKKLQAKGLVPNSRVLSVEREQARLAGEEGELRASKASALNRVGEVELRILQLREDSRTQALTELRDTEAKINELQERQIALASRLGRASINSPITGTVYQLAVHTEGGVVGGGETLMLIVPEGDDLVLQAQVLPNDIDQILVGQAAHVRFPALNARLTPEIVAQVQQVAADTSRADVNSPPFYPVRLVIPAGELRKLGDSKLKPGMTAEAFIQTDARSPLSYLIRPLMDQFARAMRET